MAYSLLFAEPVAEFLRSLSLSRQARIALFVAVGLRIRKVSDEYRADPRWRLAAGSSVFQVKFLLRDEADGVRHRFRFLVDDASAVAGVLHVVRVDHDTSDAPPP